MNHKEHFSQRVGKPDNNLLRVQIFIAFAILIHKKGKRTSQGKVLDVSQYTLPMPLKEVIHHFYGQIEFVCPYARYEFDYFTNTMDLANLYDCLVEEIEKFNE